MGFEKNKFQLINVMLFKLTYYSELLDIDTGYSSVLFIAIAMFPSKR